MMNSQELNRLGKIAGVDALVITLCKQSGRDVSASMRFVDVTTRDVKAVSNDRYNASGRYAVGATAHSFYIAIGPCEVCADSPYGRSYCE